MFGVPGGPMGMAPPMSDHMGGPMGPMPGQMPGTMMMGPPNPALWPGMGPPMESLQQPQQQRPPMQQGGGKGKGGGKGGRRGGGRGGGGGGGRGGGGPPGGGGGGGGGAPGGGGGAGGPKPPAVAAAPAAPKPPRAPREPKNYPPREPPVKKDYGYVDEDFAVDPDARYTGTVAFYSKLRGYGFVTMEVKGFAPNDSVFVHWRDLRSQDRFPSVYKGLDIEFGVQKWKERGKYTLRCKDVSLPGGGALALQDTVLAEKKEFVGGQDCRYAGLLKFYNPRTGIGYVTLDTPVDEVPAELRVERSEVNFGNTTPGWMSEVKVECGIWKTARGFYKAYNMTLPGGAPITMAAVENRVGTAAGQTFTGEVTMWNWQKGWGFIKPAEASPLPEDVTAKLSEQATAAVERATAKGKTSSSEPLLYFSKADVGQGQRIQKGVQVMFQLYMDDKGAGASGITVV